MDISFLLYSSTRDINEGKYLGGEGKTSLTTGAIV